MSDADVRAVEGLVARLRAGDDAAEAEVCTRFADRIYFLAWNELRSVQQAEDVRSETLLRVLQALRADRVRDLQALPAFVSQTARFVVMEMRRKTRHVVSLDETIAAGREPAADVPEPADVHAASALRTALGQLGVRDRAFLRLYYYEDLSREEIAERLGVREEGLRLIKSRALDRCRRAFARVVGGDT